MSADALTFRKENGLRFADFGYALQGWLKSSLFGTHFQVPDSGVR